MSTTNPVSLLRCIAYVLIMFAVFSNCEREEVTVPSDQVYSQTEIQSRNFDGKSQFDYLSAFEKLWNYQISGEASDVVGFPENFTVHYTSVNNNKLLLTPLVNDSEMKSIFILDKNGEPFLLRSTNALSKDEIRNTDIPLSIVNLFKTDVHLIYENNSSQIIEELNENYIVSIISSNELFLQERASIKSISSASNSTKLLRATGGCSEEEIRILVEYYNNLYGLEGQVNKRLFYAITDAIASMPITRFCLPPNDLDVLENLIISSTDVEERERLIETYITQNASFGIRYRFPLCSSTFDDSWTPTGDGATVAMECLKIDHYLIDWDLMNGLESIQRVCYELPELCIATGAFEIDENGAAIPVSNNGRSFHIANAFDEANICL